MERLLWQLGIIPGKRENANDVYVHIPLSIDREPLEKHIESMRGT